MELWIWDVAHGSAAYLRTPANRHYVFDLGIGDTSQGDAAFSPLLLLKRQGVNQLDGVTITHPHRDHLDDISHFDSMSPRALVRPKHLTEAEVRGGNRPGDIPVVEKYFAISERYNTPVSGPQDPFDVMNAGVQMVRFQPSACDRSNLNNHSVVTFISYAGARVCLPGDNEAPSWKELLQKPEFVDQLKNTHVFVAPHHGREAGFCADLFAHLRPHIVIVSDGPETDTSAVPRYHAISQGWPVSSRSHAGVETRYVLTTRKDGSIKVSIAQGSSGTVLGISTE